MTRSLCSSLQAATRLTAFANLVSAVRARCGSRPLPLDLTGSQRRQLKRLLQDKDHELQMGAKQLAVTDDTIQRLVRQLKAEHCAKKRLMSGRDILAAELHRQQQQLDHSHSCIADQSHQLGLQASSLTDQQTQISSLTAALGSCQQQLSEKDAHLARQQLQLAAEQAKVDRLKEWSSGRQAADAVVQKQRDAALAERDAALAKADSKHQLLGRVADQLTTLKAKLGAERQRASAAEQRASTAEQSSTDSATLVLALRSQLSAKDTELEVVRSRLCASTEPSSGRGGVQGQVQWEELQQGASSHSNPLYTAPPSPMHGSLPISEGPWGAVANPSPKQVGHGLPDSCPVSCNALGLHTAA